MKKLGMIGGLGPESTVDYYKQMFVTYRERVPDGTQPTFLLNSLDVSKAIRWLNAGDLPSLADYLSTELSRLVDAGATLGMICANTPHIVFDEVQRRSAIPLISIVEAACAESKSKGLRKVGLLGTRFTMKGRFYPDVFTREGIEILAPNAEEVDFVHHIYLNELLFGDIREATRQRLLAIIDRMAAEDGIEGLLLGGTELSLILKELPGRKIELLDTMKIHVSRAISEMLA